LKLLCRHRIAANLLIHAINLPNTSLYGQIGEDLLRLAKTKDFICKSSNGDLICFELRPLKCEHISAKMPSRANYIMFLVDYSLLKNRVVSAIFNPSYLAH
jgi:hypothetical protein